MIEHGAPLRNYPIPSNESARQDALAATCLVTSGNDPRFQSVASLAAHLFKVPVVLVTLLDADRQVAKSAVGMEPGSEMPRSQSFCSHAILDMSRPLIVPDAALDPRFAANPLVIGPERIRFYAGVPIVDNRGHALGALCILDREPRQLSTEDEACLKHLASSISNIISLDQVVQKWRDCEEKHLRTLSLSLQTFWTADEHGEVLEIDQRLLDKLRILPGQAHPRGWMQHLPPGERRRVEAAWIQAVQAGTPLDIEFEMMFEDGSQGWFCSRARPHRDAGGKILRWFGSVEDITEQKRAHTSLQQGEQRLITVLEGTTDRVVFLDADWQVTYMNSALLEVPRFVGLVGQVLWDALPNLRGSELERQLLEAKALNAPRKFEWFSVVLESWLEVNAYPTSEGMSVFLRDVNDVHRLEHVRRNMQQRLVYEASHDALTGLSNRTRLQEQMASLFEAGVQEPAGFALLLLGLDDFKTVNDTLGPAAGDALLVQVAERLKKLVPAGTRLGRIGSDEFSILRAGRAAARAEVAFAGHLIAGMADPFIIDGNIVLVSASVGIAMVPGPARAPGQLLQAAGIALYRAKEEGRGACRVFVPEMQARLEQQQQLRLDLGRALDSGELVLFYQPLIDLPQGRVGGFEALLRWQHPTKGLVPPLDFIPAAEESGLIIPLGAWVLRTACQEAMRWPADVKVAVNLSPVQFRSPDLPQMVERILAETGLPARRLKLEITETVLLQDSEANLATLHALRRLGILLALDDFGTGYASLSYLQRFPFDKIKVDQCFIRSLLERKESRAIVRSVLDLAGALGIGTTAEGVETAAQLSWLREAGCAQAQGYYFSRPIPQEEIAAFFARFSQAEG